MSEPGTVGWERERALRAEAKAAELLEAARLGAFWLDSLCQRIDPHETIATVVVKGGTADREVVKVMLSDSMAKIKAAIASVEAS